MKPADILEWTMGWPWPVVVLLSALVVWGIWRFLSWDEGVSQDAVSSKGLTVPEGCVCTCS